MLSPPKWCSAQQAATAKHSMNLSSEGEDIGLMKMRLRSVKLSVDPQSKPLPTCRPNTWFGSQVKAEAASKPLKVSSWVMKGAARGDATTCGQGRGKGKVASNKAIHGANAKGKRKAGPLEDVLGMSDDMREVSYLHY